MSPTLLSRPVCKTLSRGIGVICMAWVAMLSGALCFAEPADQVLEALRERGHEELAIEFLDFCENDPLVSDAFRARIPAERITSQLALANEHESAERRAQAIRAAANELDRLANSSTAETAGALADATGRLAIAMADESRRLVLSAQALPEGSVRGNRMEEAREAMKRARKRLKQSQKRFEEEVEKLKSASAESEAGQRRLDIKGRLAQARLIEARLLYEEGETYAADSADAKRLNKQASEQLAALYEKYSKWIVGLYAHLYEGRCYQRLGENALAVACFEDLTSQPASTRDLRKLSTLAYADLVSLWLGEKKIEKALGKPADWLNRLPPAEQRGAEAARLKYWLGEAALAQAEQLQDKQAQRRRMLAQARDWLAESGAVASEVQADARESWAQAMGALGVEPAELGTFDQAYAAGKEAIASLGAMRLAAEAASGDPSVAEQLAQQAGEAEATALRAFEAAANLADKSSPQEQVSEAKYLYAWLLWESGEVKRAAEMSEKLAREAPGEESADDAVRLALAALEQLVREGQGAEASAAATSLASFAKFVNERWPSTSPVVETASAVLLNEALRAGRLDQAEALIASVDEGFRPALALRFEVVRWEKARSAEQKREVLPRLKKAYETARDADQSQASALAAAALYLAQAALESNQVQQAIELLTAPEHGPLTLAEAGKAPAASGPFRREVLRTAAWARAVSAKGHQQALNAFEEELAKVNAEEALRARLALAVPLRKSYETRKAEGKPTMALVAVLKSTLLAINESLGGDSAPQADWNTRVWLGQSLLKLGEADEASSAELFATASKLFADLVARAERDVRYAPSPNAVLAVRLQGAQCALRVGQYSEAHNAFVSLLRKRPAMLDVQRDAAICLQQWGVSEEDSQRLEQSIGGAELGDDNKNVVWGWSKIAAVAANAAARDPKYNDMFFEAWLNVAKSRFLTANLQRGAERVDQLSKAESTLRSMRRQYPDLGGKQSESAFDALLREIQTALGKEAVGLSAFDNGTGG